jgi:hypothetical protein
VWYFVNTAIKKIALIKNGKFLTFWIEGLDHQSVNKVNNNNNNNNSYKTYRFSGSVTLCSEAPLNFKRGLQNKVRDLLKLLHAAASCLFKRNVSTLLQWVDIDGWPLVSVVGMKLSIRVLLWEIIANTLLNIDLSCYSILLRWTEKPVYWFDYRMFSWIIFVNVTEPKEVIHYNSKYSCYTTKIREFLPTSILNLEQGRKTPCLLMAA